MDRHNDTALHRNLSELYAYLTNLSRKNAFDTIDLDFSFHVYLYKVTVPALFGLIMFLGIIGNSMVIFVIVSKKKMRTTVNLLLLNLAFSDITFNLICVPFVTYHFAGDDWLVGDVICKLYQFLLSVTVYVTVYTLICISVVRFLMIVYAHRFTRIRTKRNVCMLIGIIWAIMMIANLPILLIYRVKTVKLEDAFEDSKPYYYCAMENVETGQRMFLSFFVLTYILPLSFICTFYVMLLKYLRFNRQNSSVRRSARGSSSSSGRGRERASFASRILMVVVAVFGICWLPLHAHLLLVYFGNQPQSRAYEVFRVLCHFLAYSNSCMNPFIYNYVSKDFRRCFRDMLSAGITCFRPPQRHTTDPDIISTYDYKNENATGGEGTPDDV